MQGRKWINTNSFKNFKARELQEGAFRVMINKGDFEGVLFKKSESKNLFVVLSGGRDPEKHKWPFFQHLNWQDQLDGHVLYVADPTLFFAKDLRIGWYVGTQEFDWLDELRKVVEHVSDSLGVAADRIYPIGEASGGFAALMLAAKLGNATAIAINPQTDVLNYHKKFVAQLLDTCFNGIIASRVPGPIKSRLSAATAYQRSLFAKAIILQNKQNAHHYTKHYLPFCKALDIPDEGGLDSTGRIQVILYDQDKGTFDSSMMLPILQQRVKSLSN